MKDRKDRLEEVAGRLATVRAQLPSGVELIVVTKNFPAGDVEILYELGERNFGENRVQELVAKRNALPEEMNRDSIWHFQGQVQSNKIPALNKFADVIHSLDSLKAIGKIAVEKRTFLQVNLDPPERGLMAGENGRAGIEPSELLTFAEVMVARFAENFLGVMAVAPHFEGIVKSEISEAFSRLKGLSDAVRQVAPAAQFISAGMSEDFAEAVAHGATHVRIGSSILGSRVPAT